MTLKWVMKKKVWDVDWIPPVQEESCGELFWTAH